MGSPRTAVLGAGSWGTALAMHLARQGVPTSIWGRNEQALTAMARDRRNSRYLPDALFPESLNVCVSFELAVDAASLILIVTPSHGFGEMLSLLLPSLDQDVGVAWACKGFEPGSGRLLHEVAAERLGSDRPIAVVTGPSFAAEVAQGLPTCVTVAGENREFVRDVADTLHGDNLRVYTSSDIVGAELGGAVKNVMAVATGISDGMGLGDNSRAALITRGLAEIVRLGIAMGAEPSTLFGLSGMGDLVLTCTGDLSRNRRLGLALGQGKALDDATAEIGQVVEGVGAAAEVATLSQRYGVEMPISAQVLSILNGDITPQQGVRNLLSRESKSEN